MKRPRLSNLAGFTVGRSAAEGIAALTGATVPMFRDEDHFRTELRKEAQSRGFLTYHTRDSRRSDAGFPDEIWIGGGLLLAIETKMPGNKPSAPQLTWLEAFAQVQRVESMLAYPKDWARILEMLR